MRPPLSTKNVQLHSDENATAIRVEVVDSKNRPLFVLPLPFVLRQKMRYRLVMLILRKKDKSIFLKKRPHATEKKLSHWGLFLSPVYYGEAALDAALRLTEQETGLTGLSAKSCGQCFLPEWNPSYNSIFSVDMPGTLQPLCADESTESICVDKEELEGLIENEPELLAPEVHYALQEGLLFIPRR